MESLDKHVDLKYDTRGSNFNKLEFEMIIFCTGGKADLLISTLSLGAQTFFGPLIPKS